MSDAITGMQRALTDLEGTTIDFLLEESFLGRDQLREQLSSVLAVETSSHGEYAVRFIIDASTAPVPNWANYTIPVTAISSDIDGQTIEIALELDRQGRARRLRWFRPDGQPLLRMPLTSQMIRQIRETRLLDPPPPEELRPIAPHERAILDFLLVEPFPGRDLVRQQLATAQVVIAQSNPPEAIVFAIDSSAPRLPEPIGSGCPVHAMGEDADGMPIDVSIHYDGRGHIWILEIVRLGGDDSLLAYPTPEGLTREVFLSEE